MQGFTLIHDACGQTATLTYLNRTDYLWDGEEEHPYDTQDLILTCDHCNVTVQPDAAES